MTLCDACAKRPADPKKWVESSAWKKVRAFMDATVVEEREKEKYSFCPECYPHVQDTFFKAEQKEFITKYPDTNGQILGGLQGPVL